MYIVKRHPSCLVLMATSLDAALPGYNIRPIKRTVKGHEFAQPYPTVHIYWEEEWVIAKVSELIFE